MAITITGENVLLDRVKYDALCASAAQATRYEKVVDLVGEVLNYTGWEDDSDDDAKDAFKRLRAAFEAM